MAQGGVNGKALAVLLTGSILAYSGVKGKRISAILRSLIAGQNPANTVSDPLLEVGPQGDTALQIIEGQGGNASLVPTGPNSIFGGVLSATAPPPPAANRLPATQIYSYARQAGFNTLTAIVATAIALAESGGNASARCYNCAGVAEDSRGLWQINVQAHPQYGSVNLYDPLTNARAAYAVSGGGTNFNPWSTFTSGAYLGYLGTARTAAG